MSEKRIKVVNETNHGHAVRMLMRDGNYKHRRLARKGAFVLLSEEQFIDLYTTTRDFRGGFLSFDDKQLSEEIKMALGLPIDEEEKEEFEPEFKVYTDAELKELVEGNTNTLKKFIKENSDKEAKEVDELKRRLFLIAEKNDEMSRAKAEAIEDFTGKSFKVNAQNDEENK